jgi:hypothetical protein
VPAYAATGVLEVQESLAEGLKRSQEDLAAIASELPAGFSAELQDVELSEVLKEVRVREVIEPDRRYKLLGVKWWGEGAFIREERYGREVKGSGLARVQKGWIIYNRLFAYRGAFAVLAGEHDGSYVSNEFPTFTVRDGWESPTNLARYLVYCLTSPATLAVVTAGSTGSTKTSRARFMQDLFLTMTIGIPKSTKALEHIVELMDRATRLRANQRTLLEESKLLHEGIGRLLPAADWQ